MLDSRKEMLGVMSLNDAILMAEDIKQDVILLNSAAVPPLVRLCSVSKYRYEIEKDKKEAQKKQRNSKQVLKELKLSPRIAAHDLQVGRCPCVCRSPVRGSPHFQKSVHHWHIIG